MGTAGGWRFRSRTLRGLRKLFCAAAIPTMLGSTYAHGSSVAEFYEKKSIDLSVGFTTGGMYDSIARVVSRHLGSKIPGNPKIVVRNVPGAGSLNLSNQLYNVMPKDGSAIATISRGMVTEPLLGRGAARFDTRQFTWLGSVSNEVSLCAVWHSSPIKEWNDVLTKDFTMGGLGAGSDNDSFALMLKNVFGARLKLVSGYPGGNEIVLAMERGELDGRCGWSWGAIASTKMDWVTQKKIRLLVQLALSKSPQLDGVPLIMDLAKDERQKQILRLMLARQLVAWPFVAPPGLPADRKEALRNGFDALMKDPAFISDMKRIDVDVEPTSGVAMERLIDEIYRTPSDVVRDTRKITGVE
jgi:tripartite-type tricarboxylate transporter receptor subunit TctC